MAEMYCLMYIINILYFVLPQSFSSEYSFVAKIGCRLYSRPVVHKNQRLPFIVFIIEVPFHLKL